MLMHDDNFVTVVHQCDRWLPLSFCWLHLGEIFGPAAFNPLASDLAPGLGSVKRKPSLQSLHLLTWRFFVQVCPRRDAVPWKENGAATYAETLCILPLLNI